MKTQAQHVFDDGQHKLVLMVEDFHPVRLYVYKKNPDPVKGDMWMFNMEVDRFDVSVMDKDDLADFLKDKKPDFSAASIVDIARFLGFSEEDRFAIHAITISLPISQQPKLV